MAITKVTTPSAQQVPGNPNEMDVDVEMPDLPEGLSRMTELPDGGVEFGPEELLDEPQREFGENLTDYLSDSELMTIGSDLVAQYESDKRSRAPWERTYREGLDLLGLKMETRTQPWANAAGVYHPVLAEAVIRFEAQAILELVPSSGPADINTFGKEDNETAKRAQRVKQELNFQTMTKMTEFRAETEQMLFQLAPAGSTFKKVYRDPITNRPCSIFVPADDFVVAYGTSDLATCPRYAHVMRRHINDVKKLQAVGFYRDVELPTPTPEFSEVKDKNEKLQGITPAMEYDDRLILLEFHVDYEVPGEDHPFAVPYIITVEKSQNLVLSIRRNWREEDPTYQKRMHFVHYLYLPGLGFYGTGLIHVLGGLTKSATSILRQLIDAGTLSVLPSGYKARGFRVKANDTPIRPGEFRDTDVPAGTLRDSIFPLPVKEPSPVMFQLLQNVVEEARKVGSMADMEISGMSQQAPVGTTLALLERNLKVMSGVQARLHAAMQKELRLIADIIAELGDDYEYDEQPYKRSEDFMAVGKNIIPVSDPNASMMAQRVVQYQAAMETAYRSPEIYNMPLFHQHLLRVLAIKDADKIVVLPEEMKPTDPVSENMAILNNRPVKAFLPQDHMAHIQTHVAMAQDPMVLELVGQSPNAQKVQGAMAAHIAEHLAFAYRAQIEQRLGVQLPPPGEQMEPEMEARLSQLVSQAATMLLEDNKIKMAQKKAEEEAKDPMLQLEKEKLDIQRLEVERKRDKDKMDAGLRIGDMLSDQQKEKARLGVEMYKADQQIDAAKASKVADAGVKLVDTVVRERAGKYAVDNKPKPKPTGDK
jgi:hypothetical protein